MPSGFFGHEKLQFQGGRQHENNDNTSSYLFQIFLLILLLFPILTSVIFTTLLPTATKQSTNQQHVYDVIIVGAGFSGVGFSKTLYEGGVIKAVLL